MANFVRFLCSIRSEGEGGHAELASFLFALRSFLALLVVLFAFCRIASLRRFRLKMKSEGERTNVFVTSWSKEEDEAGISASVEPQLVDVFGMLIVHASFGAVLRVGLGFWFRETVSFFALALSCEASLENLSTERFICNSFPEPVFVFVSLSKAFLLFSLLLDNFERGFLFELFTESCLLFVGPARGDGATFSSVRRSSTKTCILLLLLLTVLPFLCVLSTHSRLGNAETDCWRQTVAQIPHWGDQS